MLVGQPFDRSSLSSLEYRTHHIAASASISYKCACPHAELDIAALGFSYEESFAIELILKPAATQPNYAGLFGDHDCTASGHIGMVMQQQARYALSLVVHRVDTGLQASDAVHRRSCWKIHQSVRVRLGHRPGLGSRQNARQSAAAGERLAASVVKRRL